MTPAIETRDLTKHFGSVRALEGLNLTVAPGEVLGLLGPNGAGKTTTIRLLLDFLRPTRGWARVLGQDSRDASVRRWIGYLPADLHLEPRYTAAELFSFFGRLRGGYDPKWLDALIERFGLDPHRRIGELSTGNRRKVGIIQAFLTHPELLILDEPSSGLDPLLQQVFMDLLGEAAGQGATVLLSSHVLPEVERVANQVAILRRGRLVTLAPLEQLRRQARQRLDLYVDQPDPSLFAGVPGVLQAITHDGALQLVVEGSVAPAVEVMSRIGVHRIVSHHDDLEDVFFRLYQDDAGDAHGGSAPSSG
jgi:ABC-2 type transport system ATP-binding protein